MKRRIALVIAVIILMALVVGVTSGKDVKHMSVKGFESLYKLFMRESVPHSMDKFFNGSEPEVPGNAWLGQMLGLEHHFVGIIVNLQQNDIESAKMHYKEFSDQYENTSTMVPEFRGYFNIKAVNKLGKDLDSGNVSEAFRDIGKIGETCDRCHKDRQPQVWAKFFWKNFDDVKVNTSNGDVPWKDAMLMIAGGFGGIGINLEGGKLDEAKKSFGLYKMMYQNLKDACNNCHNTPRHYYVSDDVFKKIDELGTAIDENNASKVIELQTQLGGECYRCHVLHRPAQYMKEKMDMKENMEDS